MSRWCLGTSVCVRMGSFAQGDLRCGCGPALRLRRARGRGWERGGRRARERRCGPWASVRCAHAAAALAARGCEVCPARAGSRTRGASRPPYLACEGGLLFCSDRRGAGQRVWDARVCRPWASSPSPSPTPCAAPLLLGPLLQCVRLRGARSGSGVVGAAAGSPGLGARMRAVCGGLFSKNPPEPGS